MAADSPALTQHTLDLINHVRDWQNDRSFPVFHVRDDQGPLYQFDTYITGLIEKGHRPANVVLNRGGNVDGWNGLMVFNEYKKPLIGLTDAVMSLGPACAHATSEALKRIGVPSKVIGEVYEFGWHMIDYCIVVSQIDRGDVGAFSTDFEWDWRCAKI